MCRTTLIFEGTFTIFDTNWQNVNIHRFDKMDSDEEDEESDESGEENEEENEGENEEQTNEDI